MSKYQILKAVEYDKCSAAFKKANPFDTLLSKGWLAQPKYDGCFGMAVIKPNPADSRMLSRTGEDYTKSCQHILDEIHACADATLNALIDEGFVILGEVWHPTLGFPAISGLMRQQRRVAEELVFVANDLLPAKLVTGLVYEARLRDLADVITATSDVDGPVYRVKTYTASERTTASPEQLAMELKALGGFDGLILRDRLAGYTIGDAKKGEIIKVKPVLSLDLECTGWLSEPGEKTGRPVYSIEVRYKGVCSRVGSGMPHTFADVPQPGQIVEIECMGLTEDGKLREPRFKGVRFDKLTADA